MKAVDVLEHQRHRDDRQHERSWPSGILQDDVGDDIAGVAAAVDDLFEQFVKVLQHDDLERLVLAAEQGPCRGPSCVCRPRPPPTGACR